MNEQLQLKLVEILSSIQSATKTAGDFAMEQLPDIAMQYVMYGRVMTTASSGFLLLIAIALFSLAFWAYKNPWNISDLRCEKHRERSDSNGVVIVLGSIFGSLFGIIAFYSFDWMVWIAPKAWLLKELATFVR